MKWHYFILFWAVLALNIISCLAWCVSFSMKMKKSVSAQREMQNWKIQASISKILNSNISSLQRTFSIPRLHRVDRVIRVKRYIYIIKGLLLFYLASYYFDGGWGEGCEKRRKGTWRHLVLYERVTLRRLEKQEGRISRKYYLREGITEHGEAGS